jgi:hypothetical protein
VLSFAELANPHILTVLCLSRPVQDIGGYFPTCRYPCSTLGEITYDDPRIPLERAVSHLRRDLEMQLDLTSRLVQGHGGFLLGFLRHAHAVMPEAGQGAAEPNESQPIISLRPSTTRSTSSSGARATRLPIPSTESVRTWLILTQDRFGKPRALLSSVSGKPDQNRPARPAPGRGPD